jgi:TetR/AcrR family transcriptional regulator
MGHEDGAGEVGIRERILRESARLFATRGFAATSIRDITQAARVTNPMIYYYFGSKEELFLTIMREAFVAMQGAIRAGLTSESTLRGKLVSVLMTHYEKALGEPDLVRMFFSAQFGPMRELVRAPLEEHMCVFEDAVAGFLRDACGRGELCCGDVDLLRLHLGGLIHTPILGFLLGQPVELSRATAEALVDQFLSGVAGPAIKGEAP